MTKHQRSILSLFAFVFPAAATGHAQGALLGTTVSGQATLNQANNNIWNTATINPTPVIATVVDPGTEFSIPAANPSSGFLSLDADFTDSTLLITFGNPFSTTQLYVVFGLFFTQLQCPGGIGGVDILSNTIPGASVDFTADSISVHIPGEQVLAPGASHSLLPGISGVPEAGLLRCFSE
jgi:hypothetical protein